MEREQGAGRTERSFDPAEFRRALGQFPTGVTIVTALSDGRPIGMTANSFTSVSLDPPLIAWCVAKGAPSHGPFYGATSFAVHVLGADHHDLALTFAKRGSDKFAEAPYQIGALGAPLIEGLAPIFECRTWARYPGGDHTILVGEVIELVLRVQDPLLFHSGVLRRMDRTSQARDLGRDSFAKNYLAYLLARASRIVSDQFHAQLAEWGLSVAEWRITACLSDTQEVEVAELAAMALTGEAETLSVVESLERDDWIEVAEVAGTPARSLVRLTEVGRRRIAPVIAAAQADETRILRPFTGEERAAMKYALDLLIDRHVGSPSSAAEPDRKRVSAPGGTT